MRRLVWGWLYGSGMNGTRRQVRQLLADPRATTVVVEHRVRLGRMKTGLVEAALSAHGRRLVVLDGGDVTDDLVRDTHDGWRSTGEHPPPGANTVRAATEQNTHLLTREERSVDLVGMLERSNPLEKIDLGD